MVGVISDAILSPGELSPEIKSSELNRYGFSGLTR